MERVSCPSLVGPRRLCRSAVCKVAARRRWRRLLSQGAARGKSTSSGRVYAGRQPFPNPGPSPTPGPRSAPGQRNVGGPLTGRLQAVIPATSWAVQRSAVARQRPVGSVRASRAPRRFGASIGPASTKVRATVWPASSTSHRCRRAALTGPGAGASSVMAGLRAKGSILIGSDSESVVTATSPNGVPAGHPSRPQPVRDRRRAVMRDVRVECEPVDRYRQVGTGLARTLWRVRIRWRRSLTGHSRHAQVLSQRVT